MEDSSKLPINRVDYLDDKIDEIYSTIDIVVKDLNTTNEKLDIVDSEILPGDICYSFRTSKTGWLLCNGQAVSRTEYADLFEVIGTTYGGGDGSTTFNVPNCSGKFLQMDTSKTIGTNVVAGLPNISGTFQGTSRKNLKQTGAFYYTTEVHAGAGDGSDDYTIGFDASRSNAIYGKSTTVQPPAIIVNYFIKY